MPDLPRRCGINIRNIGGANMLFNPKDTLPGAINSGFVDGHAELVRLERLWSLDWHKGWVTPTKRPGK